MARIALLGVLLAISACAHGPSTNGTSGTPVVAFEEPSYDGYKITGRVRIEAENGPVLLDGRLIENVSLYLYDVLDCKTGSRVRGFLIEDYFPPAPTEDDLVTVNPGYFYGTRVEYTPFRKSSGPDCIDVIFTFFTGLRPAGEQGDAKVQVRFQRSAPESSNAWMNSITTSSRYGGAAMTAWSETTAHLECTDDSRQGP